MKKKYLSVALVIALAGSMLTTSCIGNFALTNKLLAWTQSSSGAETTPWLAVRK